MSAPSKVLKKLEDCLAKIETSEGFKSLVWRLCSKFRHFGV